VGLDLGCRRYTTADWQCGPAPPTHVAWEWLTTQVRLAQMEDLGTPHAMGCLYATQVSISHWRQLDGSRFGSLPHGQSYELVPIHRKNEGAFLMMFFQGKVL
jgi:hypothetical protein